MEVGSRRCAGRPAGVGEESELVVGQGQGSLSLTADVSLLGVGRRSSSVYGPRQGSTFQCAGTLSHSCGPTTAPQFYFLTRDVSAIIPGFSLNKPSRHFSYILAL